jgi:serine protease Do
MARGRMILSWLWLVMLVASTQQAFAEAAKSPNTPTQRMQQLFAGESPQGVEELRSMQDSFRQVAAQVLPCTVGVNIGEAWGSGVIVSKDGYVLTAAHVAGRPNMMAHFVLNDGRIVTGITLGLNRTADAGMMKITTPGEYPFAPMGDSQRVKEGHWSLALGHPGGYSKQRGMVLRSGRISFTSGTDLISDCTLVGGDSGGPLFNMHGHVIGIHSRIAEDLIANHHVPVNIFRESWDRLVKAEVWGHFPGNEPSLGVKGPKDTADAKIAKVLSDSPAAKAGIKEGDVVLKINEKQVTTFASLVEEVQKHEPEERVKLEVMRENTKIDVTVRLGRKRGGEPISLPELGFSRLNPKMMAAFKTVAEQANPSTVRIFCDKKWCALGTVVDAQGYIFTKASELKGKIECQFHDQQRLPAKIVGYDRKLDLAMLQVERTDLKPVVWGNENEATLGSWLVTAGWRDSVGSNLRPMTIGTVSANTRAIPRSNGGLGVELQATPTGAGIRKVLPRSAAEKAGLLTNDIITHVGDKELHHFNELQKAIFAFDPGDEVQLVVKRGDETLNLTVVLGSFQQIIEGERAEFQNSLGGRLSQRRAGFARVLQHDTVLDPEQCGGPILNLEGQTVGMNIARAGRVESYALAASVIQPLIADFKAGKYPPPSDANLQSMQTTAVKK